jgi:hypothetical protein
MIQVDHIIMEKHHYIDINKVNIYLEKRCKGLINF